MHLHENAEHRFERGDKALLALRDLSQRVGKVLRRHLDEHIQRVGVADAVNHDLIIGRIPLLQQHRLNLRREDVHALDNQHIVAAAHGFAHLDMCPTARTLLVPKNADIACPVAQQRESLLRNRGEHQFTLRSFRKHFAGVWVDNFCDKMIFVDVHAGLCAALIRHTRAGKFSQTVNIICFDTETLLDILPHLLTPCLRTENTGLQMDFVLQPALVDGFCQIRSVGRRAA